MQRLKIKCFGPISSCEIEIKDFMIFTGAQAAGKSTVAKSVFFFNDIKNLLFQLVHRVHYNQIDKDILDLTLAQRLKREIRNTFLQIFGSTMAMDPNMQICYVYDSGDTIELHLIDKDEQRKFADVIISDHMWKAINTLENDIRSGKYTDILKCKNAIDKEIFNNELDIIYIPAGRSLITLLSSQINYLYSTMDDIQKRSIDYCTKNYLERILRLKQFFVDGYGQLINNYVTTSDKKIDVKVLKSAHTLIETILKGEYRNIDGEERLQISPDHYVKINFASSGQQESVWILNVLFYYMLNGKNACFIIEEPESHLFPYAQMLITEFISLAKNHNNRVIITTHSPYVLGSINNMLYAQRISSFVPHNELYKLIQESCCISFDNMGAFFLNDGIVKDCTNPEMECIHHEIIDEVSGVINDMYEQMVILKETYEHINSPEI